MNNIAKIRKERGFTQKQVALELNVSCPTVSDWEKGKKNPNHENLLKLAQLLSVSTDYLLGISTANAVDDNLLDAVNETDDELLQLYGNPYQANKLQKKIANHYRIDHPISDDDIRFALSNGDQPITDAQFEEVKQFVAFIRARDAAK